MRAYVVGIVMIAGMGLWWAATAAQQEQAKVPGPGTGIFKVIGTVDVGNVPTVLATQAGQWKVDVANAPEVRVAGAPPLVLAAPEFLKIKSRCDITWTAGDRETVQLVQLGPGGWVRVQTDNGRQRWVNLALARSVEIVP